MSIWDILFNLCISVLSIIIALYIDDLGEPRLYISIKLPKKITISKHDTIFLNLLVKNEPRQFLPDTEIKIPFIKRETAYSCHGFIQFYNENQQPIGKPMQLRWSSNPEPLRYEIVNNNIASILEPRLIKRSGYLDITRDEAEEIDVAFRYINENEAYGWNSESYLYQPGSKNPDFRLPEGNYIFDINIICSKSSIKKKYRLINQRNIQDFYIEELKS